MFERLIQFAIGQRSLVMLVVAAMAALGIYNYQKLPIDAVPDITNVQVQINTAAPGYSPLETEQPVRDMPSASASAFMVDAVPMVLQWPADGAEAAAYPRPAE